MSEFMAMRQVQGQAGKSSDRSEVWINVVHGQTSPRLRLNHRQALLQHSSKRVKMLKPELKWVYGPMGGRVFRDALGEAHWNY